MGMFDNNNEMHITVFRLKKGIIPVIVKIPKTNANGIKMRYNSFILKKEKRYYYTLDVSCNSIIPYALTVTGTGEIDCAYAENAGCGIKITFKM